MRTFAPAIRPQPWSFGILDAFGRSARIAEGPNKGGVMIEDKRLEMKR
jgi:hypothetical protein